MLIEKLTAGIKGKPQFAWRIHHDENPLSGRVKERLIASPNQAMREVHQRLIDRLRSFKVKLPSATGGVKGGSPVANIRRHQENPYFYLLDFSNAYGCADGKRLAFLLTQVDPEFEGGEEEVYEILQKYCLAPEGGLVTGAPASPDLFNLYAGLILDRPFETLGAPGSFGLTYSRYIDDLTFSSKDPITWEMRRRIRTITEAEGFRINHRKCQVMDLKKGPVVICGIGLELGGRLFLPGRFLKELGGFIHRAMRNPNPESFRQKIDGKIGILRYFRKVERRPSTSRERHILKEYRQFRRICRY